MLALEDLYIHKYNNNCMEL